MILPLNSKVAQNQKRTDSKSKFSSLSIIGLPIFLILIMGIGILPGYLKGGKWYWFKEKVPSNLAKILSVKKKGFPLPNWEVIEQNSVSIGGKDWLRQIMQKGEQKIELLMLPQPYYKDKPGVEWSDLEKANVDIIYCRYELYDLMNSSADTIGVESDSAKILDLLNSNSANKDLLQKIINNLPRSCQTAIQIKTNTKGQSILVSTEDYRDWQTSSHRKLIFDTQSGESITANFMRGWSPSKTVAVVNWYAWYSGGDSAPERWFWEDLKAQLSKKDRAGWVAISLRIPFPATEEIESVENDAKIIAQEIQNYLMKRISPDQ